MSSSRRDAVATVQPIADPPPGPPTRAALGTAVVLLAVHGLSGAALLRDALRASAPADTALRVDPNVATREELMLLPGIGPVLADNIIAYRTSVAAQPAFHSAADLDPVKRIGPATIEKLRPYLKLPDDDGAAEPWPRRPAEDDEEPEAAP